MTETEAGLEQAVPFVDDSERHAKRHKAAESPKAASIVPAARASALRSVLKVFVVRSDPNYAQPWQMRPQRSSTGSAFVVDTEKRHIITNAHVVSSANTVHVRRPGNPKKWRAKLLCDGKICDLALLTVEDPAFWDDDMQALTFVPVPETQDEILVSGYPMGGDSLSITKGIVSRIVMTRYAHAGNKLLGIQIDAAINPGNSGGPAFANLQKGQVAGVAFSKLHQADNVGYVIPDVIVKHFLEEYHTHGTFRGCCSVGYRWQDMENTHLREALQVPPHRSGSLVYMLDPLSSAADALKVDDVVLEIDGIPVADDGTIQFRNEERIEFSHIVRSKHIGEQLRLLVLREGQEMEVSFTLGHRVPLVPVVHGVDCVPSYFIVGGLVLLPLTVPFLEHAYGSKAYRSLCPVPVLSVLTDYREEPDEQVVVLFQILAAEINFGYKYQTVRVVAFNGTKVRNLPHMAELVDNAEGQFMKFELDGGKNIILQREQAVADGPKILQQHAIAYDRSADLRMLTSISQTAAPAPVEAVDGRIPAAANGPS